VQKCVRTGDIEEVGKTSRHGTFFQMNGNFSFGDYFKADAITFAWELMTTSQAEGGYGLDKERLWATVYLDDDEAADLWLEALADPGRAHRPPRHGGQLLVDGRARPVRAMLRDLLRPRARVRPAGGPAVDEDRYMEIWNLVFMQNVRGEGSGKDDFPIVGTCRPRASTPAWAWSASPRSCRGVDNLYEIDEVYPVLTRRRSWPASSMARAPRTTPRTATPTTCSCASWPTTSGPR
jgi:alanyl-tRNA synthetase